MKSGADSTTAAHRRQKSMLAVQVGLVANIILAVLKAVVGVVGHSPALLADGINSTSDVAYGLVVSIFQAVTQINENDSAVIPSTVSPAAKRNLLADGL